MKQPTFNRRHFQFGLLALPFALTGKTALAHGDQMHGKPAALVKEQKPWGIAAEPARAKRTVTIRMTDDMKLSPNHLQVVQGETLRLRAVNAGAVMLLTLWYLMRGQPASRDPLVAAWLEFVKRLRRAGLAKAPSEPPIAFGRRLSAALPTRSAELESLSRRYAADRYARGGLPGEERRRLIAELRAFRPGKPPRPTGDSR